MEWHKPAQKLPHRRQIAVLRAEVGKAVVEKCTVGFETGAIETTQLVISPLLEPGDERPATFEIGASGGRQWLLRRELPCELVEIDAKPNERRGGELETDRWEFSACSSERRRGQGDQRRGGALIGRRVLRGQQYEVYDLRPFSLPAPSLSLIYIYGVLAEDWVSLPVRPGTPLSKRLEVDRAPRRGVPLNDPCLKHQEAIAFRADVPVFPLPVPTLPHPIRNRKASEKVSIPDASHLPHLFFLDSSSLSE